MPGAQKEPPDLARISISNQGCRSRLQGAHPIAPPCRPQDDRGAKSQVRLSGDEEIRQLICTRAPKRRPGSGGDSPVTGSYFKAGLEAGVCACTHREAGGADTGNWPLVTSWLQLQHHIPQHRLQTRSISSWKLATAAAPVTVCPQALASHHTVLHRHLALGVQVGGRGSLSPGRQGKIDMYL